MRKFVVHESTEKTWLEDAMASWWRSYFAAGNSDLAVLESIAMARICSNSRPGEPLSSPAE